MIPAFGDQDICAISRNEVMAFSRELLATGGVREKGLSPKTVNSTMSVLKNILEFALREKNSEWRIYLIFPLNSPKNRCEFLAVVSNCD